MNANESKRQIDAAWSDAEGATGDAANDWAMLMWLKVIAYLLRHYLIQRDLL